MKNVKMWAGAAALALVLAGCDGKTIRPGSSCSAEGSKHTNPDGVSYTCLTVPSGSPAAGQRIWQQDKALTPDRP